MSGYEAVQAIAPVSTGSALRHCETSRELGLRQHMRGVELALSVPWTRRGPPPLEAASPRVFPLCTRRRVETTMLVDARAKSPAVGGDAGLKAHDAATLPGDSRSSGSPPSWAQGGIALPAESALGVRMQPGLRQPRQGEALLRHRLSGYRARGVQIGRFASMPHPLRGLAFPIGYMKTHPSGSNFHLYTKLPKR